MGRWSLGNEGVGGTGVGVSPLSHCDAMILRLAAARYFCSDGMPGGGTIPCSGDHVASLAGGESGGCRGHMVRGDSTESGGDMA